jgi:hypothetical protein
MEDQARSSAITEASNRADATALLIRCGFRVYRPEADIGGEDLIVLTPHMHLRGKDARFEATYPDGRKETLLLVPHYNFNWQITYRMAEPKFIPKGTRLAIVSHFDNSPNNPLNPDPGKVVRWGEASEMEMMDGWIEYVDTRK